MNRLPNEPQTTAATKTKNSFLASNPVMRRLNKVEEYDEVNSATYGGITAKTVYFLLFTVAGIILQLILAKTLATGQTFDISYKGFEVTMYLTETIALAVAVVLAIVFQLLAFFARGTTPVTGALYCVTQGYFISFLIFKVLHGKEYLGLLALVITMVIILVMAILYTKGIIKVTKKFKTVMMTLFITVIGVSLLMVVAAFIPFTQPLVQAMQNNLLLSIGFTVIFIIIAALFLICDFDTIDRVVTNKLPKKYEWQAAFGLAFTVIWLYLKVLDLIITISGNKK
ncbi:MAG: Bax inhibitor-1/YccA family protein [Ruminococcus sp.]|uniref:Bax inhibitor-1/YccA family membrane protein n=1 Tax=Ruminococcus sp. TaxID=41978 RepID=UPI002873D292|nr:Bax inhibitor-1/YccA family protein [Ruminococcus sp.]MBQ3284295.1 Bax inhibitor-1/YccA family protein [Ruminococcus sp.]